MFDLISPDYSFGRFCAEMIGKDPMQGPAYWLGKQLQRLAIEGRDHPIDGNRFAGLLESGDLRATHASRPPFS